jgi:hypothetical protein
MSFEPKRISELDPIPSLASGDFFVIVDVSDTAAGTTKKVTVSDLINGIIAVGFDASAIISGTIADARLSSNVTVQGNTFNGANQLVQLNGSAQLPALSGGLLTNLNAGSIFTGTISDLRLSSNVTIQGNVFNIANRLVQLDASTRLPVSNGSQVTDLNASNLTTGTLPDLRLSNNVMFKSKLVNYVTASGTVVLTNALTDQWHVTSHTSGNVVFGLGDAPAITAGSYFRIFTNSNQTVQILPGASTTIYYFGGSVTGTAFTPAAQRGRTIELYCVANNTIMMTGDIL